MVLKTLHLTNAWHASSGGVGTFYRALLKAASAAWRPRLVVPAETSRYEPWGAYAGIYHVRAPRAPVDPNYRILYPHCYLLPASPLREILAREQPHVLEVNDKFTLPYLGGLVRIGRIRELRHLPVVVGISCERLDRTLAVYTGFPRASQWFARVFMKWVYFPQSDAHIAVSPYVAEELESASRGHKVTRGVWVRGMGVDTEAFHPGRRTPEARRGIARRAGVSPETALLLYAGRLAPEKNLELLLDMLDFLPEDFDYALLVAGDGPCRAEFLAAARRRAPHRVFYWGHEASRSRLAELVANCDVFLHPNPHEPFGIAPLEAMASGTALVAPDQGGVTCYANSNNAWILAPEPAAFARAVGEILSGPAERARRTQAARQTALNLSWPVVARGFQALYQDLYARHRGEATHFEPAFYSTPGNWFGFETPSPTSL